MHNMRIFRGDSIMNQSRVPQHPDSARWAIFNVWGFSPTISHNWVCNVIVRGMLCFCLYQNHQRKIQSVNLISDIRLHRGSIQTSHTPDEDSHVERVLKGGFSLTITPEGLGFCLEAVLGIRARILLSNWWEEDTCFCYSPSLLRVGFALVLLNTRAVVAESSSAETLESPSKFERLWNLFVSLLTTSPIYALDLKLAL